MKKQFTLEQQEQFEINKWIEGMTSLIQKDFYSYRSIHNSSELPTMSTADLLTNRIERIKLEMQELFKKYSVHDYLVLKLKSLAPLIENTIEVNEEFITIETMGMNEEKVLFDDSLRLLCTYINNCVKDIGHPDFKPKKERNPTYKGKPQDGMTREDKQFFVCYLANIGCFPKRDEEVSSSHIPFAIFLGVLTGESLDNMVQYLPEIEKIVKANNYQKKDIYRIRLERLKLIMESIGCHSITQRINKDLQ